MPGRSRRPPRASPRRRGAAYPPPPSPTPRPRARALRGPVKSPRPTFRQPSGGLCLELLPALVGGERIGELVEVSLENLIEAVAGVLDPVVRHPPLREVVGAHLLRALTRADLRPAIRGELLLLLAQRVLIEPRAQHPHRALPVLELGLLVLHRDHDPARLVRDSHRR